MAASVLLVGMAAAACDPSTGPEDARDFEVELSGAVNGTMRGEGFYEEVSAEHFRVYLFDAAGRVERRIELQDWPRPPAPGTFPVPGFPRNVQFYTVDFATVRSGMSGTVTFTAVGDRIEGSLDVQLAAVGADGRFGPPDLHAHGTFSARRGRR